MSTSINIHRVKKIVVGSVKSVKDTHWIDIDICDKDNHCTSIAVIADKPEDLEIEFV
jgi:hypothetical protein